MKKLRNTEAELKKSGAYKKTCTLQRLIIDITVFFESWETDSAFAFYSDQAIMYLRFKTKKNQNFPTNFSFFALLIIEKNVYSVTCMPSRVPKSVYLPYILQDLQ